MAAEGAVINVPEEVPPGAPGRPAVPMALVHFAISLGSMTKGLPWDSHSGGQCLGYHNVNGLADRFMTEYRTALADAYPLGHVPSPLVEFKASLAGMTHKLPWDSHSGGQCLGYHNVNGLADRLRDEYTAALLEAVGA